MSRQIALAPDAVLAEYAARNPDAVKNLAEVLTAESQSGAISAFDLTRVKIPTGGSTHWLMPTPEGETSTPAFDAIVLDFRDTRSHWENPDPSASPPDCSSEDAQIGNGAYGIGSADNPSGKCETCPKSKFGSRPGRGGQACRSIRQLFLLQPDGLLPTLLFLPPSSLRPFRRYSMSLASAGLTPWSCITTFKLIRAQAQGGVAYAQVAPVLAGRIPPGELGWVNEYREALLPSFKRAAQSVTDLDEDY